MLNDLSKQRYQARAYAELGESESNQDRWLVSYADFMTLLMAFFVVMYSISQVSEQKYRVLSETFSEAFKSPDQREVLVQEGEPQYSHTKTPIDLDGRALEDRPGNDANQLPATFATIKDKLEQSFQSLVETELVTVTGDERWLQIELSAEVLFESGGVKLSEPASEIVSDLAAALAPHNNVIQVEGFTDNVPISSTIFASNWELSAARAAAVVKLLADYEIDPGRMAAVGYGEYQPTATNTSDEGRTKNRRIVLMVSTQDQFRSDVFVEELPVEELPFVSEYAQREPLPEGTLVRGLKLSARDQAAAWLDQRYGRVSQDAENAASAETGQSVDTNPEGDTNIDSAPTAVNTIQLENGALLFTRN